MLLKHKFDKLAVVGVATRAGQKRPTPSRHKTDGERTLAPRPLPFLFSPNKVTLEEGFQ
jgi:hypothetical protein